MGRFLGARRGTEETERAEVERLKRKDDATLRKKWKKKMYFFFEVLNICNRQKKDRGKKEHTKERGDDRSSP